MEECKKRARDEPESDSISPESKRVDAKVNHWVNSTDSERVDSGESKPVEFGSDEKSSESNGGDAELNVDSPETRQFRDDILDILDEPDTPTERNPASHDLDSVIKSLEEEILHPAPLPADQAILEMASSDSGESQPDLGYLLEASDDELGLPPSVPSSENQGSEDGVDFSAGASVLDNLMGFEDELPSYDSFDLGIEGTTGENYGGNNGGEFVTVDGLFDFSEPSDFSELQWRPESLPAL